MVKGSTPQEFSPGLAGVPAAKSSVSFVNGQTGLLIAGFGSKSWPNTVPFWRPPICCSMMSFRPIPVIEDASEAEKNDHDHLLTEHKKLSMRYEKVNEIIRSGSASRKLPARPEPILQIEVVVPA